MKTRLWILLLAFGLSLNSCVAHRKYTEMQAKKSEFERQNETLKTNNEALQSSVKENDAAIATQQKRLQSLERDTTFLGNTLRVMQGQYDKINDLNEILMSKNTDLLTHSAAENQKLLDELNQKQLENIRKEDQLLALEQTIEAREANLNTLTSKLGEREAKVLELQNMLAQKDAAAEELRSKLSKALLGFKDKGLTVEEKDGKVYVSMEAKLLFPSGSTSIDPQGKKALIDLAKAIEGEKDLGIIVEGHTDTDKMNAATIPRDNWELSVLRATSVVKIMLENSQIDPTILSAAGRSEYIPVDADNKAKNRRIEIVLSPNLNELMQLIQN